MNLLVGLIIGLMVIAAILAFAVLWDFDDSGDGGSG